MMGPREAASMDRLPPAPARCGTTPIQPTGEVRPALASRARNQAREPRRHRHAPTPRKRPRAGYARIRVRCSGKPAAGRAERSGTKRDGGTTCRMLADTASRRQAGRSNSPLPLAGEAGRGPAAVRFGKASRERETAIYPGPPSPRGGSRKGGSHARNGYDIGTPRMENMTSHDIP